MPSVPNTLWHSQYALTLKRLLWKSCFNFSALFFFDVLRFFAFIFMVENVCLKRNTYSDSVSLKITWICFFFSFFMSESVVFFFCRCPMLITLIWMSEKKIHLSRLWFEVSVQNIRRKGERSLSLKICTCYGKSFFALFVCVSFLSNVNRTSFPPKSNHTNVPSLFSTKFYFGSNKLCMFYESLS